MGNRSRRRYSRLDGGTASEGGSLLMRRQRRLPDPELFRLGATLGGMGRRKQSAELHIAGIRRGLRSASRNGAYQTLRAVRPGGGRGSDASHRLFGSCPSGGRTGQLPRRGQVRASDLRAAADSFLSGQPRGALEHPDRRPPPFHWPRRRARGDRRRADRRSEPGCDCGGAWAAWRRQDHAGRGLR